MISQQRKNQLSTGLLESLREEFVKASRYTDSEEKAYLLDLIRAFEDISQVEETETVIDEEDAKHFENIGAEDIEEETTSDIALGAVNSVETAEAELIESYQKDYSELVRNVVGEDELAEQISDLAYEFVQMLYQLHDDRNHDFEPEFTKVFWEKVAQQPE